MSRVGDSHRVPRRHFLLWGHEVIIMQTYFIRRIGIAVGAAHCVLGDIQLSMGDFAGAEASFRQAHALGWDPQPGLARLHLMTGRPELAQRELERALADTDWTLRERRGQLLCLLVHAAVAAGKVERGREALHTLATDPQMLPTEALKAI